jgi:cell wall-associated NlpC family hydrolase
MKHYPVLIALLWLLPACDWKIPSRDEGIIKSEPVEDTVVAALPAAADSILRKSDSLLSAAALDTIRSVPLQASETIDVKTVNPEEVLRFAETLVGTPYVYGSTDPKVGFDCSGFITYVFNHFGIRVPRSSVQFTNVGKTVPIEVAKRGDIVLFTDPDFDNHTTSGVGHMGLILSNTGGAINFIHSTSGKAMSVAITPLSDHYKKRFVRVGRIFPQNDL